LKIEFLNMLNIFRLDLACEPQTVGTADWRALSNEDKVPAAECFPRAVRVPSPLGG